MTTMNGSSVQDVPTDAADVQVHDDLELFNLSVLSSNDLLPDQLTHQVRTRYMNLILRKDLMGCMYSRAIICYLALLSRVTKLRDKLSKLGPGRTSVETHSNPSDSETRTLVLQHSTDFRPFGKDN